MDHGQQSINCMHNPSIAKPSTDEFSSRMLKIPNTCGGWVILAEPTFPSGWLSTKRSTEFEEPGISNMMKPTPRCGREESMLSLSPERLRVLQDRVLLFDGFSGDEVMQLLQHANKKTIGDGELIVEEGLEARLMYILISGQAVVSRQHGHQAETLAILEPGATVGEMAMVDSAPRSAQVAARGTAIVLEFGPDALSPAPTVLLQKLYRNLSIILARRLRSANKRMETIAAREGTGSLTEAQVRQMDLSGMDLTGARAKRTKLAGADLRGADLRDADLRGADLRGSRFDGADLRETDLMTARLKDFTVPPAEGPTAPEQTEQHWETLMKSLAQRARSTPTEDD